MGLRHLRLSLFPIALFLLFTTVSVRAEVPAIREGETLALPRCIEIALKRHPDLAAYAYEVEAREAQAAQARKDYFPKIDVTGGYTRYNPDSRNTADNYSLIPLESYSYYSASPPSPRTSTISENGKRPSG